MLKRLKIAIDKGAGESKLFVGATANKQQYDAFFNNFDPTNSYQLKKENLLDYLKYAWLEYVAHKCNEYKDVDSEYHAEKLDQVSSMSDLIPLKILSFEDTKRYYIRADEADKDKKNNFNKFIRGIALPKISDIVITKDHNNVFTFELLLNYERVCEKDTDTDAGNLSLEEFFVSTSKPLGKPHQRIFFGAPGTGKSYKLNQEAKSDFGENYARVTFHPNYMYGNFIGSFKPFVKRLTTLDGELKRDDDGNTQETITYQYVAGALMQQLIKAYKNTDQNYLLVIDEINRANVASVFGDVFQLLDRDNSGYSEYEITTSKELQDYLKVELENVVLDDVLKARLGEDFSSLVLPPNLYIWATMNSADQGVMPMDTAFRRRWDFTYIGVNEAADSNKDEFLEYEFKVDENNKANWDLFRRQINRKLSTLGIPEDKLLGSYFIGKQILETKDLDTITNVIKNKVLMYLYEDAAKPFRSLLFAEDKFDTYSIVCDNFTLNALDLFRESINIQVTPIESDVKNEKQLDIVAEEPSLLNNQQG